MQLIVGHTYKTISGKEYKVAKIQYWQGFGYLALINNGWYYGSGNYVGKYVGAEHDKNYEHHLMLQQTCLLLED